MLTGALSLSDRSIKPQVYLYYRYWFSADRRPTNGRTYATINSVRLSVCVSVCDVCIVAKR